MSLFRSVSVVLAITTGAALMTFPGAAGAAPTGAPNAQSTIGMLQAQGFRVLVSRVGDGPLDKCTVNAVRPGRKSSQTLIGVRTRPQQNVAPTVYVDLVCHR